MSTIQRQAGLSIIELMISLLISSFLILGITQVYIDNKRNQVFHSHQMGNLENGRYASLVLDQYLSKAGYRRNPSLILETAFPSVSASDDCLAFNAGDIATGLNPEEGVGFCIRYQPQASGELDCQGSASSVDYSEAFESLSSDDLIVLAFKFVPNDDDLEEGSLQCKNLNASNPQYNEMLKGVADMRLDFGIGSSSAIDKEITSFVSQSEWSASSGAIHGINYSLLLASGTNQRDSDDSQILSNWLAASTSATQERLTAADNKRIYQVASNTQILRNLMP